MLHLARRIVSRPLRWRNAAVIVVLAVLSVGGLYANSAPTTRDADWMGIVLVVGCAGALWWRRSHPVPVLVICGALVAARHFAGYAETADALSLAVAAYSVGAHVEARRNTVVTAVVTLAIMVSINVGQAISDHDSRPLAAIIGNTIVFGTAFLLGDNVRRRRQRLRDLEERAHQLERDRIRDTERAVHVERTRIARELHDVLAHSLSVVAVQAGAARRVVTTKPDGAIEAIAAIEATARASLDDLRRVVGRLRDDDEPELRPQQGLSEIDQLLSDDLNPTLTRAGPERALAPTVDASAFRIVQEAVTNVRKHAGPCAVVVTLRFNEDHLALSVTDNGRGAAQPDGGGFGLVGMRERAALCGGTLNAGPHAGGGWIVTAVLPYGSP